MPNPAPSHRSPGLRFLALGAVAAIALSTAAIATSRKGFRHAELVAVDHVPPDACVAFYGPGPCREHGQTIIGSTDAVALWPLWDEANGLAPTAGRAHR